MSFRKFLSLSLALPLGLFAMESGPWLTPTFELRPSLKVEGQNYRQLAKRHGNIDYVSHDFLAQGGIEVSAFDLLAIDIELAAAESRARGFSFDHVSYEGRWLFLDDIVGDPVSLAADFSYTHISRHALHDPSFIHRGRDEYVLGLSVGKEWSCSTFFTKRLWGNSSIGIADRGAPWLKMAFGGDYRIDEIQWVRGEFLSEVGFGKRALHHPNDFKGYGALQYRAIDLRLSYEATFCDLGEMSVSFLQRLYAKNGPSYIQVISFQWTYPFGL